MSTILTRGSSNSTHSNSISNAASTSFIARLSNKFKSSAVTAALPTSSAPESTSTSTSSTNSNNMFNTATSQNIISSSPYGVIVDDILNHSTYSNYFEESNNNLPVVINSYKTVDEATGKDYSRMKVKVQSLIKYNGLIYCGVTGIVGKLDEDRFSLFNDQKTSSTTSFLHQSFSCGLFDGHGGYFGSEYLSQSFLLLVQEEYQYKLSLIQKMTSSLDNSVFNMNMLNVNGGGDILDTFMCESIRKVTKYISREIKMRSITGSTCVALFVRKLNDGSFRVYCSNTGDSRCVMIHYKHASSSSSTANTSETTTTTTTNSISNTKTKNRNSRGSSGNNNKNNIKNKLTMSTVAMTEDHKISNSREYIRIVSKQPVVWYPLPCQAASVDISTTNDILSRKICTKHIKTYPTLSRIQRALILIDLLNSMSPISSSSSSSSLSSNVRNSHNNSITTITDYNTISGSKSPTTASLSLSSSTFLASNKSIHNKQLPQINRSVSDRHRKDLALSYLNDNMSDYSISSKVSDKNKNNKVSELLHLMSLGEKAMIIDNDRQTGAENNGSEHSGIRGPVLEGFGSDLSVHGGSNLNGLDKSLSDLDLDSRHHGLDNSSGGDNNNNNNNMRITLTSTLTTMLSFKAAPTASSLSSLSTPTTTLSARYNNSNNTSNNNTPGITPRSEFGGGLMSLISEIDLLYTDAAVPLSPSFNIVNNAYNTIGINGSNSATAAATNSSKHRESISNIRESLNSPRLQQLTSKQSVLSSSSTPRKVMLNDDEIDELSMHSEGFVGLNNYGENNSNISNSNGNSTSSYSQGQKIIDVDDEVEGPFITAPIKNKESFISQRVLKNGQKAGPEALFSRHNVSTTMTRSVGDRHAARSCVCTPEITAITIGNHEYARFILGSDGIFDVIDNDKAVKLIKHILDPIEASKTLSKYARMIRESDGLRMDDITCIVVDINPHLNPNLTGNGRDGGGSEWKNLMKKIF